MEKFPLPLNSFVTVNTDVQHILNTPNDPSTGYILEVDLEYPDCLNDSHRDSPLARTKKIISYNDLSTWQQDMSTGYFEEKSIITFQQQNKEIGSVAV